MFKQRTGLDELFPSWCSLFVKMLLQYSQKAIALVGQKKPIMFSPCSCIYAPIICTVWLYFVVVIS